MAAISYKCPNCGAEIKFDPISQKGKCEFCLSEFNIEEIEKLHDIKKEHITEEDLEEVYNNQLDDIEKKASLYLCPRCGAEIIADNNTTTTFCCYCHGPIVMSDKFTGDFKPSKIIPFKIDKDTAIEEFIKWSKSKWFLSREFTSYKQLEKITGIYIPFWLINSSVTGQLSARGKKITVWTSGDYKYVKTDVYDIYREADLNFKNVPHNASNKMNDKVMEAIEPYNYSDLKEFSIAYLPGFISEKYDMKKEEVLPMIEDRIKKGTNEILNESITGYSSTEMRESHISFNKTKCNYALLPVWMMTYSTDKKEYIFVMNGQDGKVFGTLPISKQKLALLFITVFCIVFLAVFLGGMIL